MALQQFISLVSGRKTLLSPTDTSTGAADAGKIVALNTSGKVDSTMVTGGAQASLSVLASEAISAGDFVNVYSNAGTLNVRKADNTASGKEATGFALAAIANGVSGTVTFQGENTALSALTPGTRYYLGAAGAATTTPPTTTGYVVQFLGTTLSATSLMFRPDDAVVNG